VVGLEEGALHGRDGTGVEIRWSHREPGGEAQRVRTLLTTEPYAAAGHLAARDLTSITDIYNACWAERIPGEPPMSVDAYVDDDAFTHAPEVILRRLARDDRGDVVGFGHLEYRDGEPGGCVASVYVAPGQRGAGAGAAVAAALVAAARDAGRAGITFEAEVGSAADSWCERAGLRPDMVVEQNRALVAEPSEELLASWVATGEGAEGYSLVAYDGACADEALAAAFVEARHVMNDAPRWEGEPPASFTVAELRAAEAAVAAARMDWWSLGVRHDATGAIVGLSELYLPRARPWIAFQGDTGVAPLHRGHRLGAWMKAVNHRRLRAERPAVTVVQTWNASANAPMLRINRALGFRPVQTYRGWYLPFD
jgi:GNAT superfamily N-acetyltransferase